MTAQEVFNKVATHLFTQNEPAYTVHEGCRYRLTVLGKKLSCAAGCLIPDEVYSGDLESTLITDFPKLNDVVFKDVLKAVPEIEKYNDLISDLQQVHDGVLKINALPLSERARKEYGKVWDTTRDMREALAKVATKFNLDASILENLSFTDR